VVKFERSNPAPKQIAEKPFPDPHFDLGG
jgi:hypothetical protein